MDAKLLREMIDINEAPKNLSSKIYYAISECNRTRMNLKLSNWDIQILTEAILAEFK